MLEAVPLAVSMTMHVKDIMARAVLNLGWKIKLDVLEQEIK